MKIDFSTIRQRELWGAHALSRAGFGASAEIFLMSMRIIGGKVRGRTRDHEGVMASRRCACAPRMNP